MVIDKSTKKLDETSAFLIEVNKLLKDVSDELKQKDEIIEDMSKTNIVLINKLSKIEIACDVDSYQFAEGNNLIETNIILNIIKGKEE